MTSFIVQLKKGGGRVSALVPKEREREIEGCRGGDGFDAKKETERRVYGPRLFLSPNPLFYFFFFFLLRWVSNLEEPPSEEQTAEGLRRHPKPLCEVFIKSQ